jgi:hypothetical protein
MSLATFPYLCCVRVGARAAQRTERMRPASVAAGWLSLERKGCVLSDESDAFGSFATCSVQESCTRKPVAPTICWRSLLSEKAGDEN